MSYYTIAEFKEKYVVKQRRRPFQQNIEGHALLRLAKSEGVQVRKVPGARCAKLKPGCLGEVNAYPVWLLIRYFGNQLNEEGLKLKSGRPLNDEEKGANDDNI